MKTPPPKLKLREPNPASPFAQTEEGAIKPSAAHQPSPADGEKLLPFGNAAKAIFIRANGLRAYYKSAGTFRYTR